MKKPLKTLNKKQFVSLVARRMQNQVTTINISNVISLFIDEFSSLLKNKKQINIPNFGLFRIEKSKPRKFYHIGEKKFAISTGKFLLKIRLSHNLRDKIIQNLDIIKTFL